MKLINARSGNFWDISYEVLSRIEGSGYLENKASHNQYLKRDQVINLYYSTGEYA